MAREGQPGQVGKAPECTISWGHRPGREWGVDVFQAKEWCAEICMCEIPLRPQSLDRMFSCRGQWEGH